MLVEIRQATEEDVQDIVAVKQSVWPQEETKHDFAVGVVRNPTHTTLIAVQGNKVAGFVDGFMTTSANGIQRWEVDLLAVDPAYRGLGIATQLVMASTNAGRVAGASATRALVGTDNAASQRTFARCSFVRNPSRHALYVGSARSEPAPTHDAHFIPVSTMNYTGVWVEGRLSKQSLTAAQAMRAQHHWDVAGAVIPVNLPTSIQAAQEVCYALVGEYEWWQLDLNKP